MRDDEKGEFDVLIRMLFETFRKKATTGLILGYWIGLHDLSMREVKFAARQAIRTSTFCPSVAELRRYAASREDLPVATPRKKR